MGGRVWLFALGLGTTGIPEVHFGKRVFWYMEIGNP